MSEPNPRSSRLALAGGLVVAIALASVSFLVGRSTVPEAEAPALAPQPLASSNPASRVLDEFDRAALLALASRAADAYAANQEIPAEVMAATGRRFDLVMPFGCDGPSEPESSAALRWRYDAESQTLRAAAVPNTWRAADWSMADRGIADTSPQVLALRGFWIPKPWTSATACIASRLPRTEPGSGPMPLSEDSLAIARWSEDTDSSNARSFEIVRRTRPEDFAPNQGLRLRIVGRIAAPPDTSPVRCVQPLGAGERPSCMITASFNEVRIENGATGAVLGAWPIADVTVGPN